MDNTVKKGFSLFIGAVILLSLVYINVQPTRAATSIDGLQDAVWFDSNGNGICDSGEGLFGIDVYLDNSGLIGATTSPAPLGSFSNVFSGVAPGSLLDWDGLHYLTFKSEGFLTVTYNVDNSSGALSLPAGSVQMILADSIYGRVTGTDGKALAGIEVEVLNYVTHAVINTVLGTPATTRTDQFGNYVFSGISSGTYDIRASKEEYMDQVKNAVQVIRGETTENVNFILYPNNGTVQGHISNGGAPVQGAVVSIPGLGVSGVSDSNGDYVITGVMPGSYTVICEKDGYKICVQYYKDSGAYTLNPAAYSEFVQPGAAVTTLADFNLVPEYLTPTTGYVSGIVLDENMRPIEAATVEIPGLGLSVATDKMGYYMFVEVPNGEYDVVATDACPIDDKLFHKTKKQRVEVIPNFNFIADFSLLENPGFIVGQIMDKDALPVPNVPMSIPNSTISSLTDSNGWYVLEGVNIERYTVYNYTSQTISYHVAPVIVKAKEPHYYLKTLEVYPEPANESYADAYDLVIIRKTGVIKGKVFALGSGAPIEGAKVRVYGRMAITNGSGIYEFVQVPIGSYTVVADDDVIVSPSTPYPDPYVEDDYDLVIKTDNVVSAGLQTNVDFYLPAATASYYGYVSGVVYEDVNISSALEEGEGIPGITVEVPGYPTAVSDDFGFYIVKADDGVHNLVAYGGDYEWYPLVPPALYTFVGDTENPYQDIPMVKQNGELIGNISDRGDPVDEADVWTPGYDNDWAYNGTDVIGVLSDFYGNYVFASGNALPKGRHLVISQKFDHNSGDPYWYEFEFNFVNIESTITKNIALNIETGRVEGFVWDDLDGNGVWNALTEPAKPDAAVYLSKLYGATSDTTGYYTILDVPVTKDRTLTPVTPAEDPDIIYEINRYTGIAYLLGYNTETHESSPITADASIYLYGDIPLSAIDYEFCNNIEVMEDIELTDVTIDIDYPLDKSDPLPVTGDVSGRVVLSINDINAEAEVWIEATSKNTWTDIEGFWIILNVPTPTPPSYYAIQAGKPHYVTDIIYNVPVPKAIETQNIDFTLEKDGAIEGFVFEDINHDGVWDYIDNNSNSAYDPGIDDPVDVPISNAVIKIANMTVYTDSLGYYRLDGIYANAPYIPYTTTCTKDGYSFVVDYDVNVIHLSGVNGSGIPPEEVNFLLEKDEGLIIGRVSDSTTMAGIAGIDVAALDDDIPTNTESETTDDEGYYVIMANSGTYTLQAPEEPNTTDYVTKEIYDVTVVGYGITRKNFVLWDETTMPDNNIFGIVYYDDDSSSSYDSGEEIGGVEVSVPGLGLTVLSASTLTDPDGNPGSGDEYNFIFMDIPDTACFTYTVTAKMHIPLSSPADYMVGFTQYVTPGAQTEVMIAPAPSTPYDAWLEGIAFWDMNDNGVVDDNERLNDVMVFIPGSSPDNVVTTSFLKGNTDSTGYYIINEIPSEMSGISTKFTVLAIDAPELFEIGIQRNLPFQPGHGQWIDFPLEKNTSFTAAYIHGEVYFDANTNGQYDVDATPSTEGIVNATVSIGSDTQTTDSFGFYMFDGLVADQTYLVEVSATGYENHTQYITAILGYNFPPNNFALAKLSNSISGYVFEDVDENLIKSAPDKVINAKIIAVKNTGGTFEAYTDDTGFYFIPNLPIGSYTVECIQVWAAPELPEYQDWVYPSNPVIITSGSSTTLDIPMARYYVDVNGNVSDSSIGLSGVLIEWYSPDDFVTPVYTVLTDGDGNWTTTSGSPYTDDWVHADINENGLIDPDDEVGAPVGTWYLMFSKTGYNPSTKWVEVDYNDYLSGSLTVNMVMTPEFNGQIQGIVDDGTIPIEHALVKATDQSTSLEYIAYTDGFGSYTITALPTGTYDMVVSKLGYYDDNTVTGLFVDSSAPPVMQNFSLVANAGFADVTVTVDDGTANPILGALVTVWYQEGDNVFTLVAEGFTDASGSVTFPGLPAGLPLDPPIDYHVCASDNGNDRIMETQTMSLMDGDAPTLTFTLVDGTPEQIALSPGWYMLSFPVLVPDDTIWPALMYASGIDDTLWDKVAKWDNASDSYEFYDQSHIALTEMWEIEGDTGYWLHMIGPHTLKVVGELVTTQSIALPGGHWSLMGYQLQTNANPIPSAMTQIPGDAVNLMWTYDPSVPASDAQLYDPRGRFTPNGFDTFNKWHAYWVYCDVDCTLDIS